MNIFHRITIVRQGTFSLMIEILARRTAMLPSPYAYIHKRIYYGSVIMPRSFTTVIVAFVVSREALTKLIRDHCGGSATMSNLSLQLSVEKV